MSANRHLTFISSRFLFPADSGGKIRTSQILRGLKGGAFQVRLVMPCRQQWKDQYAAEIEGVCDELIAWEPETQGTLLYTLKRFLWLAKSVPVPVFSDWSHTGAQIVAHEIVRKPDVLVFDFPHTVILAQQGWHSPSVLFTHNVESEIFRRHWQVSRSPLHRMIWASQYRKMHRFEGDVLSRFDSVIAVSERDADYFRSEYRLDSVHVIPTGVDTEYLAYHPPTHQSQVVFCGSMDWMANIDAIEYFFVEIWPAIRDMVPGAKMKVVGRAPPDSLVKKIMNTAPDWQFTGYVEDVRPHLMGMDAFVIPLRIGGGTRMKAFEAMAMGCPVVSTSIGMEGLPVEDGVHYLCADGPFEFARKVASLLLDRQASSKLSAAGRKLVQEQFGYKQAAAIFEKICINTIN